MNQTRNSFKLPYLNYQTKTPDGFLESLTITRKSHMQRVLGLMERGQKNKGGCFLTRGGTKRENRLPKLSRSAGGKHAKVATFILV